MIWYRLLTSGESILREEIADSYQLPLAPPPPKLPPPKPPNPPPPLPPLPPENPPHDPLCEPPEPSRLRSNHNGRLPEPMFLLFEPFDFPNIVIMIMKIIKVLSKKVDNKEYSKYILNLPKDIVEQSNFFGKELYTERIKAIEFFERTIPNKF